MNELTVIDIQNITGWNRQRSYRFAKKHGVIRHPEIAKGKLYVDASIFESYINELLEDAQNMQSRFYLAQARNGNHD